VNEAVRVRRARDGVRVAWCRVDAGLTPRAVADALIVRLADGAGAITRSCPWCGSTTHGRPVVETAHVHASVSYAGEWVLVAVGDAGRFGAVGLDAEPRSRARGAALHGVITPGRRASLRRWTGVEAVLKADGRGLSVDPARVRIARGARGVVATISEPGAAGSDSIPYRVRRVRGPRGLVVSLATRS
jgi:4'-phosphopantetheinyl transferase